MQFQVALLSSLALHVAALAIPAGSISLSPSAPLEAPDHRGSGSPAPLSVRLDQRQLNPAITAGTTPATGRREHPAAPNLDNDAVDIPGRVNADRSRQAGDPHTPSLGVPAPRYFSAREVNQPPEVVGEISDIPGEFATVPDSGRLILILRINETGTVDEVEVAKSHIGSQLQKIVVRQFASARFVPAKKDGVAVKSRMKIEVIVKPPLPVTHPAEISAKGS